MSIIDKIISKGVTYSIADSTARASLQGKYEKPITGIPKSDLAEAVRTSLEKADSALQNHQSLSAYRTAAQQDVIDGGKQPAGDYALRSELFSKDYADLKNKPTIPTVPTDISAFENDVGYLTSPDISGKQDKSTLEADVAAKGFTKNTGTYSKPSGGIPKTDLSDDVKVSLDKADTALQTHQSLAAYRTAAAQDVIDNGIKARVSTIEGKEAGWDAKYDKPSAGIPKADLTTDVQTALTKANQALSTNGGTMSGAVNMDGNRIGNLPAPSANGDAVPKSYIDALFKRFEIVSYFEEQDLSIDYSEFETDFDYAALRAIFDNGVNCSIRIEDPENGTYTYLMLDYSDFGGVYGHFFVGKTMRHFKATSAGIRETV